MLAVVTGVQLVPTSHRASAMRGIQPCTHTLVCLCHSLGQLPAFSTTADRNAQETESHLPR